MEDPAKKWPVVLFESDWQQIFVNDAEEEKRERVSLNLSTVWVKIDCYDLAHFPLR